MIDEKDEVFLDTNIKGMMMTLIAYWNTQMDNGRDGTEFANIRPSDMRVFGHLRGRSMKLSNIHREMGYSRQAAQQAVSRLVDHGLLKVELLPGKHRDKIVTITQKGQRRRTLAVHQLQDIEKSCAEVIGTEDKEALRKMLIKLVGSIPQNP